jgi:hypothetical protein
MDSGKDSPSRDEAAEWLRDLLGPGPVATDEIMVEATAAGMTRATIRRAKVAIGAKAKKAGFAESRWFWALPDPRPVEDAQHIRHPVDVSTFGVREHLRPTARVPKATEDAQNIEGAHEAEDTEDTEGAEGAHLHRVNAFSEHLHDSDPAKEFRT